MLTITVTFMSPDSLIANYAGNPPQFPLMHLLALGQALLDEADPHAHRYRGKEMEGITAPVIVAEFPEVGKGGLTWWWNGLEHPREQIQAFGAYLMAEVANQFLMVVLQQRAQQAQAQQRGPTLVLPGSMYPMPGQNNPTRQ